MAKISAVDITSLLFQEGTAPATPASTKWRAYFKTDGLYVIDDAGTETGPLGTGGGGGSSVAVQRINTAEGTSSASYTDLATAGPAAVVTVPASGILVVDMSARMQNGTAGAGSMMSFVLSGANTLAADDANSLEHYSVNANVPASLGRRVVLTGLNTGSTTVTAKYRRLAAGTGTFANREISATVGVAAA